MNNIKQENEITFKGIIIRNIYNSEDYKVYAVDVDKTKYDVKFSKYGNCTIQGEIHDLGIGQEYEIKAIEQKTKYGTSYKVTNIAREKPQSALDMYLFLQEILTLQQAETLYNVYPTIVQKVMNNNLEDIDLTKLKGIKEFTFSKIKEKIVENFCLAELVTEFQGLISLTMLKRLQEKYTSIQMIRSKLKNDPYKCLCGLARVGFKTADGILLELDKVSKENIKDNKPPIIEFDFDLKTSEQRCLSCILYLLEENENEGHTRISITELRKQCIKLVPACSHHFVSALKHESIYYDKDKMITSLKSTYEIEKYIAENIMNGLNTHNEWGIEFEQYRNVSGSILSDEQMNTMKNICKYTISILNGAAGTGKSFSTQSLINLLEDNNKTFKLFSPTGKAAKVLSDFTKKHATTIHRGLCYMPPDEWGYNKDNKLDCSVLMIDEFSMVDIFLFKRVIDAIDFNKTKLLLIGDNAQLPSVACGNLLHDFMQSKLIPTTTLTKVFRYSEGGLMKVATDVRFSKEYMDKDNKQQLTFFGENKDYAFVNVGSESMNKSAVALYQKLLSQGYNVEDIQVLTAYNKGDCGTITLNNQLQRVANKNYGSSDYMKIGDTLYYKGDLVIQKVNNYKAEVFIEDDFLSEEPPQTFIANGETGVIKDVYKSYILIDFDGVIVKYYRNDMQTIGLGYSISIHKSQGSSIKVVILLTPQSHTYMLNSNIIYVGLTRMKEKCYHLGNVYTVNEAIKKKANLTRDTFMQDLLKNTLETPLRAS